MSDHVAPEPSPDQPNMAAPPMNSPGMHPPGMNPPVMAPVGLFSPAAPPSKGARRKGLLGLGLVVLVGGLIAGGATAVWAQSQYDDAAARLQRAPVGCDTELTFSGTGTFIFYIETTGKVGDLAGDCPASNGSYERRPGQALPVVDLTLVDTSGNDVKLTRHSGTSYDAGGSVGTSTRELTIAGPGTYTLSVVSDDTDFSIAVGRDPQADFDQQRLIALGVGLAALLIGGVVTILGLRRRPVAPDSGLPASGTPGQSVVVVPVAPSTGVPFAPPSWEPPHPQ